MLENLQVTEQVKEKVNKHEEQIMLIKEEMEGLKVRQSTLTSTTPTTPTIPTTPSPVEPYSQIKGFIHADQLAETWGLK